MKQSKADIVLNEVKKRTGYFDIKSDTDLSESEIEQYSTISIANYLQMQRSNVSKILNDLTQEGVLIKISGKPIIYFHKEVLSDKTGMKFDKNIFSKNEFDLMFNEKSDTKKDVNTYDDVFDYIIGGKGTLKNQVALAKAAVTYPPFGLNTMLIGSTGCGKSTFAEAMYKYAVSTGLLSEDANFVVFNCADYAQNPQLLVSQLFGSVKGAYTGAEKEKIGLVDKANNGILFLDEVHQLPKEGQEMLFTLMDKGIYRRVGETDNTRNANLMIIVATTEKKNSQLLNTFLRRIPISIELPDITKYSVEERLEMILNFFYLESSKTKRRINVSKKILKSCLKYDCPMNIGGLKSDIQLICAKGYFSCVSNLKEDINIKWSDITPDMKLGLINSNHYADDFILITLPDEILIDYNDGYKDKYPLWQTDKFEHENKYYNKIIEDYYEQSLNSNGDDKVRENLEEELKEYFRSVHEKIKSNQLPEYGEFLSKIVDEQIIEAVIEALESVNSIYNDPESNKRIVCALSLHINNLMQRMKKGSLSVNNNSSETVEQLYPIDFHAAKKIVKILSKELSIEIDDNEVMFVTMLLHSMNELDTENNIAVLCIAHGKSVASSIAEVVNKLLEVDALHALDMPLDESVEETLNKAIEIVKKIDKGSGVVLLTDMGSLCDFDTIISEETGISTVTITNVTTLMALEVTRRSFSTKSNLKDFYDKLLSDNVINVNVKNDKYSDFEISSYEERFIKALDSMLTFIDSKKVYYALKDVLKVILKDLGIEEDRIFECKFIIHCAFMIERSIKKEAMPGKNLRYYYENRRETLDKMKKYFKSVRQGFGFEIEDSEYETIIEMFDVNFNFKI